MIEGADPILQAAYGTLFTWGVTAAGSAVVFIANTDVGQQVPAFCTVHLLPFYNLFILKSGGERDFIV